MERCETILSNLEYIEKTLQETDRSIGCQIQQIKKVPTYMYKSTILRKVPKSTRNSSRDRRSWRPTPSLPTTRNQVAWWSFGVASYLKAAFGECFKCFQMYLKVGVNQSHSASYLDLMLDNGAELYHEQYDEHGVQIERGGRD